jgi:CHC2 zinc finger
MISDAALAQLKQNNPCDVIAARLGVRLRRHGTKMVGPCPICSKDREGRSASRFEATAEGWVCAVCADGGDVIRLVERAEGLDFRSAIAWLGGPGEVDPAIAAKRERERAAEKAKREAEADAYRQRERGMLYEIWRAALPAPGTPVEDYLHRRHIELPPGAALRYVPDMPYFHGEETGEDGRKRQRVIHRGPAMVAPIIGPNAKFRGLHFTYLDLDQSKGKAVVTDPDTGELLPAKKVRGSKAGGYIEIVRPFEEIDGRA